MTATKTKKYTEGARAIRLREGMAQFQGSDRFYRHPMNCHVVMSEGVMWLMEEAQAYWLGDAIASYFGSPKMRRAMERDSRLQDLQFWKLEVSADNSARLIAQADSGVPPFVEQAIGYTDFPLAEVSIWAGFNGKGWTLYLPSEH